MRRTDVTPRFHIEMLYLSSSNNWMASGLGLTAKGDTVAAAFKNWLNRVLTELGDP